MARSLSADRYGEVGLEKESMNVQDSKECIFTTGLVMEATRTTVSVKLDFSWTAQAGTGHDVVTPPDKTQRQCTTVTQRLSRSAHSRIVKLVKGELLICAERGLYQRMYQLQGPSQCPGQSWTRHNSDDGIAKLHFLALLQKRFIR